MTGADWGVDLVGDKGAIQTPNCCQRLRYGGPWIGRRARKLGPSGAEGIAHCASANNLEFEVRRSLREGNRHDDISNTTLHDNLMNNFPIPSLQVQRANTLAIYILQTIDHGITGCKARKVYQKQKRKTKKRRTS